MGTDHDPPAKTDAPESPKPEEVSASEPRPVISLDYLRVLPAGPVEWVAATRCPTAHEWHSINQYLRAANIIALMGDARDGAGSEKPAKDPGIELRVNKLDLPSAQAIIERCRSGKPWCMHCGSTSVRTIPAAWYWYVLAVLFVGMPPYWPPTTMCESCGRKWG